VGDRGHVAAHMTNRKAEGQRPSPRSEAPALRRKESLVHRTETLAQRLRAFADELESAERYGVPIPSVVCATAYPNSHASFSATGEEFDAWADYSDAVVEEYDHEGQHWRRAVADVNGLRVEFATTDPAAVTA
jgi:hypothetical protein